MGSDQIKINNGSANTPPGQKLNINPNDLTEIKCKCGSEFFKQSFMLKKLSIIQSPDGQERIIPVQIMLCERCGIPLMP